MTTLTEAYIARIDPVTGDLLPVTLAPKAALEQLTIAVDNYLRAMRKIATTGDPNAVANLQGTRRNLELAQVAANRALASQLDNEDRRIA